MPQIQEHCLYESTLLCSAVGSLCQVRSVVVPKKFVYTLRGLRPVYIIFSQPASLAVAQPSSSQCKQILPYGSLSRLRARLGIVKNNAVFMQPQRSEGLILPCLQSLAEALCALCLRSLPDSVYTVLNSGGAFRHCFVVV